MIMKKKQALTTEESVKIRREKTAQQWMPVADIEGSIVYRKDGFLLGAIRIQPENLALLSDAEKRRRIESLTEQWNGEKHGFQIFCIGRPVDLNDYLGVLQEKAKAEQDYTRKRVLKGYIQQASEMASSGETIERRFYLLLTQAEGDRAVQDLTSRLNEFSIKMAQAELSVSACKDDELLDIFTLFANPIQAAYERSEIRYTLPSLLMDEIGGTNGQSYD